MIESNCPTCNQRRKFSETEEKKYKCDKCKNTYRLCKNKSCNNMMKLGPSCKECVGKGMKNGGSVVMTAAAGIIVLAVKGLVKKGK